MVNLDMHRILLSITLLSLCAGIYAQDDFSDPIRCFYCFGPAVNSSCADPVNPRTDQGRAALKEIDCARGICLKWTHYWNNVLYMHRTCSHNLTHFRIMMIDGVCRSERNGNGQLCMCGKHLCNTGSDITRSNMTSIILLTAAWISGKFLLSYS